MRVFTTQVNENAVEFGLYVRFLYWLTHKLNDHLESRVNKAWRS